MDSIRRSVLFKSTESGKFFLVVSGIHEIFTCGIWNPGLWDPEYSSRNSESHQGLESEINYLESGIHNMESRNQNCLRFLCMGRFF